MKFAFYVQQFGKPREKKFEFTLSGNRQINDFEQVLKIEQWFNDVTDVRVHIEQESELVAGEWTEGNREQAEARFERHGISTLSPEEVNDIVSDILGGEKK